MSHHVNMSMGTICVGSGLYAYYARRSKPSLISGIGLGVAYFLSSYLISTNKNPVLGHDIATMTSGLLITIFAPKMIKKPVKIVPIILFTSGSLSFYYNIKKSLLYREPAQLDLEM